MSVKASACILMLLFAAGLLISIRPRSAWDEIAQGEAALFHGKVADALAHFDEAAKTQPAADVRLRIRTDLANEVCGDSESTPETEAMANAALTHLGAVVQEDTRNAEAHLKLGDVLTWRGRSDDALVSYRMSAEANPRDAWPHFRIAILLWQKAYQQRASFLASRHLNKGTSISNHSECQELAVLNGHLLQDGFSNLRSALELNHVDPDPNAFMAALYREYAEIQCGDASARNAALREAREWREAYCDQRHDQRYRSMGYLSEPSAGLIALCDAGNRDDQYIAPR